MLYEIFHLDSNNSLGEFPDERSVAHALQSYVQQSKQEADAYILWMLDEEGEVQDEWTGTSLLTWIEARIPALA